MSRIGKAPIEIPSGVEISFDKSVVTVKGSKGELKQLIASNGITVNIENNILTVERNSDQKKLKSMHGLYRQLINNMIIGVSKGYELELELHGIGYRASNRGQLLEMSLGYSHPVMFFLPDDVKVETISEKGKPPVVKLNGIDKQLVGQIAAKIKSFRKPEPYKGKGVRFKGEEIRRKAGKTAAK